MEPQINSEENLISPLKKVTPLSKYLAMALFIVMPFIGGWVGYEYAKSQLMLVDEKSSSNQFQSTSKDYNIATLEYKNYDAVTINDSNGTKLDLGNFSSIFSVYGDLYILQGELDLGQKLELTKVEGLSIGALDNKLTLEHVGGNYIKNNNGVVYVGVGQSKSGLVEGAHSPSFSVLEYKPRSQSAESIFFGTDENGIYYLGARLGGIDKQKMNFMESDLGYRLPIVHDEDTYWYPQGNCQFGYYRLGSKDELSTFTFPCSGGGVYVGN